MRMGLATMKDDSEDKDRKITGLHLRIEGFTLEFITKGLQ